MVTNRPLPACLGIAALLAVALAAPSTAGAATATTTTAAASGSAAARPTTAKALVAASVKDADAEPSVHFVATSALPGRSVTITASTSATAGTQKIVLRSGKSTGHVQGRLVDKIVYFKGDTFGLEEYLGMPATLAPKYTGKWIFFSPATSDYAGIEKSMTLAAAISQISVKAPFTTATTTIDGQAAEAVKGTTTALSSKGKKGPATLYVAATGAPLPIRYQGKGKQEKKTETGTVVFSDWGMKVAPASPQGAIAASSISSSG